MSWAVLELARHPEMQRKLQREIDEVYKVAGGFENIQYHHLFKMEYLTAVINETLRFFVFVFV